MNKELMFANDLRTSYRSMIPLAGKPDLECDINTITIPTTDSEYNIPVHLYIPKNVEVGLLPIVVFAHGGCFVSGDLETHTVLVHTIASNTQAIVAYVDYRLAPEYPFPTGLNDFYTALEWISANATTIGADLHKIAVCGDSAGANLATVATMMTRDKKGPQIVGQWLIYLYAASLEMNTESWKELGNTNFPSKDVFVSSLNCYIPEGVRSDLPYIAPLIGNHENLPPAFIQVGEYDPLLDENIDYNQALLQAGVKSEVRVYDKQNHGFVQFFKNSEQNTEGLNALNDGVEFLKSIFNR
ncbi:alpha/beta hydrolase [Flavobacterium aestivum]|uniref:alpha/beta hydrolase n=1 Tax=Flavobacterium aestivum TaxID=3003257 RepID=UPI002482DAAE|nr:alpha/beta hydrolase [Flavobacterium aestivum]